MLDPLHKSRHRLRPDLGLSDALTEDVAHKSGEEYSNCEIEASRVLQSRSLIMKRLIH